MKSATVLLSLSAMVSTAVATPVIQREVINYTTATEGKTVTVMKGDTLFKIADLLKIVGACDIATANDIKNPNDIVVGMVLKIPTVAEGKQDNDSCTS